MMLDNLDVSTLALSHNLCDIASRRLQRSSKNRSAVCHNQFALRFAHCYWLLLAQTDQRELYHAGKLDCSLGTHGCQVLHYSEDSLRLTHLFGVDSHCSKLIMFFMHPAVDDLSNLHRLVLISTNLHMQHSNYYPGLYAANPVQGIWDHVSDTWQSQKLMIRCEVDLTPASEAG